MTYDVRYLIVAGVAWIRHTDGPERAVWLATFDGEPKARKWLVNELPPRLEEGELEGVSWRLDVQTLAPPHRMPPAVLRRFASSQFELIPAAVVSGHIGSRELDHAPGHLGHVWGRRHADRWRWAHASTADGRWADVLTAKVRGLPELSFWSTHVANGWGTGGFTVDASPETFVGVTYRDPDGSTRVCHHSERALLNGRDIGTVSAVLELGSRTGVEGWPISI
jgi:hypothetical protein